MNNEEHQHRMEQQNSAAGMSADNKIAEQAVHAHRDMPDMKGMSEGEHHAMMIADFRRRFWVSVILTI
ncbi:MAG: hypothetical protein PHN78_03440, partial [Dehalococcoidales bacterium]|nr:hypothetical protein [Dehalococcoidales bacterium]